VSAVAVRLPRRPSAARVAHVGAGLTLALVLASPALAAFAHEATFGDLIEVVLMIPFAAVGVLVASRQPRNAIGWILLALALGAMIGADAGFYSVRAYRIDHHSLPLSRLAVALSQGWISMLVFLPLPILLFPDGRLPSARWRWTLRTYVAAAAILVGSIGYRDIGAFTDRRVEVDSSGELTSLGGSPSGILGAASTILALVYAGLALSWVIRQVAFYRGSTGDRREQLKWLMTGGAVSIIGVLVSIAIGSSHSKLLLLVGHAGFVCLAALPVSIGVGILRYRLYEIDRLISRTLSYALLTGLLVGVFAGLVLLTTRVLPFSSPVGVAASTLAAAGLFSPLRGRLQRFVDRRFNRARYDAEALVAAFSNRLRDAVDVDTVLTELTAAANRSLEPAHVTVWVRAEAP
jgi:hypothetical protein